MNKTELKSAIIAAKQSTNTLILAHTYQDPDIIDIADISGDSYALAVVATKYPHPNILLCGVRFMAETVKILSPEKKVILSHKSATCPMAEQIAPEKVAEFRKANPDVCVCAYINTTAALKAHCDVCVTSSTAVKIVKKLPQKDILFIPDQNLGAYVQAQVPEKNLILWSGCCPTHHSVSLRDVEQAKAQHPNAKIAMHPECRPEVAAHADMLGSTSAIIEYCENSTDDIIIATERGVYDWLIRKYPQRNFYQLAPNKLICPNMKYTTLQGVLGALEGSSGAVIEMDEELRLAAKRSIDAMLNYGG
ncbi:MAG: quinolinate synthase NadA [Oscillospiraceae bacterium]|jgi:quinolinate synthase|nr:quinolinate synthase NadA [Oscillospiraceae bacterium]